MASQHQPPEVHALSCVNCRQRKVKCAKVYPCPHCVRGGLECIFPNRKKDRAPRRNKNNELLNRLAKLEAIVGQVDPSLASAAGGHAAMGGPSAGPGAAFSSSPPLSAMAADIRQQQQNRGITDHQIRNPQKRCPAAQPTSQDDPAAKYVSGEFWANLSTEVEGIKAALEQPSDSEGDDDGGDGDGHDEATPESTGRGRHSTPSTHIISPAIFGNAYTARDEDLLRHPPPERIKKLRDIYFRNVDTLLKILHRPTIEREFDVFIVNPEDNPPGRAVEALFFAMYFAAVTSLSPEGCARDLGEDRGPLVARYRRAVELALARADYLNSTSLETLQALTLYDTCLRNHGESRACWALFALVLRMGQAVGLHRDGDGAAFPPYEAEMRRRLWAQIIVLDVRAAQDRGTEPMLHEDDYNTIAPTNVDDDDFGPGTATPVPRLARNGPTDVTFGLCTYKCSSLFLHIHGPRSKFSKPPADADAGPAATTNTTTTTTTGGVPPQITQASEEDIIQRIKSLEAQFVAPAALHPGHYPAALAASVVRLTTLIFWLTIQYPFQVRRPTVKPRVGREHMLQTAVAVIELQAFGPAVAGSGVSAREYRDRFVWWQDGYVQWHPLAVALAELCVQTEGPLVERAWATVERVFPLWSHKVADAKRGALWRPIRKLYRRAGEKRAEARLRRLRINEDYNDPSNTNYNNSSSDPLAPAAPSSASAQQQQEKTKRQRVTEQPHIDPPPRDPRAQDDNRAPPPPPPSDVEGISPLAAATELGPTGIPVTVDFGDVDMTSGMATTTTPADASGPPRSGSATTGGTAVDEGTTTSSAVFYENAHNNQWTIDFDDLSVANLAPAVEPQQELDMMDWAAWNEFVNDANVNLGDETSPSSEGR